MVSWSRAGSRGLVRDVILEFFSFKITKTNRFESFKNVMFLKKIHERPEDSDHKLRYNGEATLMVTVFRPFMTTYDHKLR